GALNGNVLGAGWNVVAAKDFNGDGVADLAFQNAASGAVYIEFMSGLTVTSRATISNTAASGTSAAIANSLDNANAQLVQAASSFGAGQGALTLTSGNAAPPDNLLASLAANSIHSTG